MLPASQAEPKLDRRFFIENLTAIPPKFSELLTKHSGIPVDQQIQHIKSIRDTAITRHPYPCLGRFRFLDLDLSAHPLYATELLPRLASKPKDGQDPPLLLDLGCCLGQDIRRLCLDGVAASQLYGADLRREFIEVGYQLFRDEDKLPQDHFLAPADALDDSGGESNPLDLMDRRFAVLHVMAVFHLFDREQQLKLARRCVGLLNRGLPERCLILGADVGNVNAGSVTRTGGRVCYRHNSDSWRTLWEEVGKETGVQVEVGHQMQIYHASVERAGPQQDGEGQKGIGSDEEGFRWSQWWVWVDFDE